MKGEIINGYLLIYGDDIKVIALSKILYVSLRRTIDTASLELTRGDNIDINKEIALLVLSNWSLAIVDHIEQETKETIEKNIIQNQKRRK